MANRAVQSACQKDHRCFIAENASGAFSVLQQYSEYSISRWTRLQRAKRDCHRCHVEVAELVEILPVRGRVSSISRIVNVVQTLLKSFCCDRLRSRERGVSARNRATEEHNDVVALCSTVAIEYTSASARRPLAECRALCHINFFLFCVSSQPVQSPRSKSSLDTFSSWLAHSASRSQLTAE